MIREKTDVKEQAGSSETTPRTVAEHASGFGYVRVTNEHSLRVIGAAPVAPALGLRDHDASIAQGRQRHDDFLGRYVVADAIRVAELALAGAGPDHAHRIARAGDDILDTLRGRHGTVDRL